MKKIILFFFVCFHYICIAQNTDAILQTNFYTIDSFQMNLSSYKMKPIVFVMINSSNPDMQELSVMDSLNRNADGNFGVIGILLKDSLNPLPRVELLNLFRLGQGLSFPITTVSKVRNNSSVDERHLIVKWLVENPANNHFQLTFDSLNQVLIVNKKLSLYAVLSGNHLPDKPLWDEIINKGTND